MHSPPRPRCLGVVVVVMLSHKVTKNYLKWHSKCLSSLLKKQIPQSTFYHNSGLYLREKYFIKKLRDYLEKREKLDLRLVKSICVMQKQIKLFGNLAAHKQELNSKKYTFKASILETHEIFLKWQPCHFPLMAFCFVVLIYLHVHQ